MRTQLGHAILSFYYALIRRKFSRNNANLETVQRERLKQIMQNLSSTRWAKYREKSYEQLSQEIPVSNYSEYRSEIETQRTSGCLSLSPSLVRYEPTSGSTEFRKWIPYSQEFLDEINVAAGAWISDLYSEFPKVKKGVHYWSLSWLPADLRGIATADDAELFPLYQRWILQQIMAVPSQISIVPSPEAAWWATLIYLASSENLSLVSVWSPTFWIKATQDLKIHWDLISQSLNRGIWGQHEEELNSNLGRPPKRSLEQIQTSDPNFFKKIWPHLSVISAWDSSSSRLWAEQIKSEFSEIKFQSKGLWATEGVVTIPFQRRKVLAYQSHFYEFLDIKTGQIKPSWELVLGKSYQPILWTSSGLLRYLMPDKVEVVGFWGKVPELEFVGRIQSVDMVGEKIDLKLVEELFISNPDWQAVTLIAVQKPVPHYHLCHQSDQFVDIEKELLKFHHYRLARDLGQLATAQSSRVSDLFNLWQQLYKSKIVGQNKVEYLSQVEVFKSESLVL